MFNFDGKLRLLRTIVSKWVLHRSENSFLRFRNRAHRYEQTVLTTVHISDFFDFWNTFEAKLSFVNFVRSGALCTRLCLAQCSIRDENRVRFKVWKNRGLLYVSSQKFRRVLKQLCCLLIAKFTCRTTTESCRKFSCVQRRRKFYQDIKLNGGDIFEGDKGNRDHRVKFNRSSILSRPRKTSGTVAVERRTCPLYLTRHRHEFWRKERRPTKNEGGSASSFPDKLKNRAIDDPNCTVVSRFTLSRGTSGTKIIKALGRPLAFARETQKWYFY